MLPGLSSNPIASDKTITIGNSGTFSGTVGLSSASTASANLGTTRNDRYVILLISGNDDLTNFTLASATVNGVSATIAADYGGITASGGGYACSAVIAIANVPAGGSVNITVTFSEALTYGIDVGWLVVYGLTSLTAVDTAIAQGVAATQSTSIATHDNSLVVGVANIANSLLTSTWNRGTKFYDIVSGGGNFHSSGMYELRATASAALTVSDNVGASTAQNIVASACFE